MKQFSLISLGISAIFAIGCSGDGDMPLVPVTGTVTFAGGPCPREGTITFSPSSVTTGLPRRPGQASFEEDGVYTASSFAEGDGLLPGTYTASFSCWDGSPSSDDPSSFERLNLAPADYFQEVVVEAGSDGVVANFDVPPKRK